MKLVICVVLLACGSIVRLAHGCGGGWAPYIPPTSSAKASGAGGGRLQVFEKGVSFDLFDPKALQPLVRNIVLSGNLRKDRSGLKQVTAYKPGNSQLQGNPGFTFNDEGADSLECEKDPTEDNANAVLNVHRLH